MAREDITLNVLKKVVVDGFVLAWLLICIFVTAEVWQPFERGFFCGDESLMFPYKTDTISASVLKAFSMGLPMLIIVICEWCLLRNESNDEQLFVRVRIPLWVRGTYCALISFGIGACFNEISTNIAKAVIGRPRPHFFDVCKPSVDCKSPDWMGRYIEPHDYHCTSDEFNLLKDVKKSFLSGHSSMAAYTMIYLAMYLEKRMTWRGTRVLRHALQFSVLMLSWYCALSRISDYKHHWSDVLAGYMLGTIFAVLTWNWGTDLLQKKTEHQPLPLNDISLNIVH